MAKPKTDNKMLGILFIVMAGFCFSLMTFFVRKAGKLPTMEKAFFRNAVAVIVAAVTLLRSPEKFHMKKGSGWDIFGRCLFGTTGMVCNFYAIDHLALADANMLNKLSPFFAIIMSAIILKEKPNRVEWAAVVIAMVGTLFVIKPSFNIQFAYGLIGVYGGFGAGLAYTFVHRLGTKGERGSLIVFCFSVFSCLFTLPFMIFNFVPMTAKQLGIMILAGISATGGQFCITTAYTKAAARDISVFDYSQIIFAALIGFFLLDELPDRLSFIGYTLIIGVAVWKWWYLRKQAIAAEALNSENAAGKKEESV